MRADPPAVGPFPRRVLGRDREKAYRTLLACCAAKQAVDQQFARWVMLHVQSNPLPIRTRPRVLIKGKRT
jgi:hypothetical protein